MGNKTIRSNYKRRLVSWSRIPRLTKGPSIAAMYAVKALIDAGVEFKTRIRFIFGTDEENLWRCLEKYNEKKKELRKGFAPDAEFPFNLCRKRLVQAYLTGPGTNEFFCKSWRSVECCS